MPEAKTSQEVLINQQMKMALEKIAFLPFGKMIDEWRWQVFSGQVSPEHYNEAWWAIREKYQGIRPPVGRTEADFDPGAKYHIPANTPYMRYFLAAILQFQYHKALCAAAGHKGPLSECSGHGNEEAARKFAAILTAASPVLSAPRTDSNAGAIHLYVDATEASRGIVHSRLEIPVKPGALTLYYPKWILGEHAPSGPIADLAGIRISAGGSPVPWERDALDMYTIRCKVPRGVDRLDVSLDALQSKRPTLLPLHLRHHRETKRNHPCPCRLRCGNRPDAQMGL